MCGYLTSIQFIYPISGEFDLDYISAKEAAIKLGVTERWVQMQCKTGKIKGALRFNDRGVWLIPKKFVETQNTKTVNNKGINDNEQ